MLTLDQWTVETRPNRESVALSRGVRGWQLLLDGDLDAHRSNLVMVRV
jgi:hypothetical protein